MKALSGRRWLQFSLRFVLLATTLICFWLGWIAKRANDQRIAVEAIRKAGGRIEFAHQLDETGSTVSPPPTVPGPAWLRNWIGDEYFQRVVAVKFDEGSDPRAAFMELRRLPDLKVLHVNVSFENPADSYFLGWSDRDQEIKFSVPPIVDDDLAALANMRRLNRLSLQGRLTDDGLQHLSRITSLEYLTILLTPITDRGLVHLSNLKNLKQLDLRQTRVGDNGLVHLQPLTSLEILSLERTHVTDAGLEHLGKMTNLRTLGLGENNITDTGVAHLAPLARLECLTLNATYVTDRGLVHLRGMPEMINLWLSGTRVGDAGLQHLRQMPKLQQLDLGGTQITDAGLIMLSEFDNFGNMEHLAIDPIPPDPVALEWAKKYARFGNISQPQITEQGAANLQRIFPKFRVGP